MKNSNFDRLYEVLRRSRHALASTHGLIVADGIVPDDTFTLDHSLEIAAIDAVLPDGEKFRTSSKWVLVLRDSVPVR